MATEDIGQAALAHTIDERVAHWQKGQESLSDEEKALTLAQLVVLLGQADPGPLPDSLVALAPTLVPLLVPGAANVHVQRNAAALLTTLIGTDEDTWKALVLNDNTLVPAVVELLRQASAAPPATTEIATDAAASAGTSGSENNTATVLDDASCVNMMACVTAAAQGGEEGAQSVINAGVVPLLSPFLSTDTHSDKLQEAAVDVLCQLGTYDSCRQVMVDQGCVTILASGLKHAKSADVRVRALLGLGMLIPTSQDAQLQLAEHTPAMQAIMAAVRQAEDQDSQQIAKSLFTGLAQNPACKPHIEAAIRASHA